MIKTCQVIIEGNFINLIKGIYKNTYSKYHTYWWNTENVSLEIRNMGRKSSAITPVNTAQQILTSTVRQEK